ncbi:MAG: hypothetical protein LAT64_10695 [Phycisphaerales bacterium]|nr:hypothetical protein [Planctomycetota bacterium]MCH8509219.1 hypothetical protein [Phycisphaerales bacterium]
MTPPTGHTPGPDDLPTPPHARHYGQTPAGPTHRPHPAELVQIRRDLFWQNVVREVLMSLASAAAAHAGRLAPTPTAAANSPSPDNEMFDGRMGVITTLGQRIPIADVVPVFACSAAASDTDRNLSGDVQCSIFRIRTPGGEIYTMPITQIVGIHSMSDALAKQLEAAAQEMEEKDADGNKMPFGFAAYTSLARSEAQGADADPAQDANRTPDDS